MCKCNCATIKDLPYNPVEVYNPTEGQRLILAAEEHNEFKVTLLTLFKGKIQENLDKIVHSKGRMTDEERGKHIGVVLVYEDLFNAFKKITKIENNGYRDPVLVAKEVAEKATGQKIDR